jgi:AcrR family transcriptional regulator
VSSLTVRPSDAASRRDAVEADVLSAVEALLVEGHTYVELSVATIARRSGVARSTFYVHFADKTELLIRLASTRTADIFAAAYEWIDGDWIDDHGDVTDPVEVRSALEATCRRIVADYRDHTAVLTAVLAATGYDPAVADYWFRRIDAFVERSSSRLGQARDAGLIPGDVDVVGLARMSAWAIERTVSQTVAHTSASDDDALSASLARGLWLLTFGGS